MNRNLWTSAAPHDWRQALEQYPEVVARQSVAKLLELDVWYHAELPAAIAARAPAHVTHDELVRLAEWKMARGVWRAPNLVLVRGNAAQDVVTVSALALSQTPHLTRPVATLATLAGVGPATASAVVSAYQPALYPFFDELVAAQVPTLGKVVWTLGYYANYATALRDRALQLANGWTPAMVECALWANAGGKKGAM